jgi:hypothetical protein
MKTFARIQDHRVTELLTTATDLRLMFHPGITWVDVSSVSGVAVGWEFDGTHFTKPAIAPSNAAAMPSLTGLQGQIDTLKAQLAKLATHTST